MKSTSLSKVMGSSSVLAIGALILSATGCGATISSFGDCVDENGNAYDAGDTFPSGDGCNTCTCEASGQISCTAMGCADGCNYNGQFYQVGDTFLGIDGCNDCECLPDGSVDCEVAQCGCPGDPPLCEQPGAPNCSAYPVCDGASWVCEVQCDDCNDAPPIDCGAPPPGCYWTGPECIDGQWTCGDLVCDPCGDDPPPCPDPGPGCTSQLVCTDFGWDCQTSCAGTCEEQYPQGYQTAIGLVFQLCGCDVDAPCASVCTQSQACFGNNDPDPCAACVQMQAENQASCALDAVLGDECQSDPECAGYIQCVISGP